MFLEPHSNWFIEQKINLADTITFCESQYGILRRTQETVSSNISDTTLCAVNVPLSFYGPGKKEKSYCSLCMPHGFDCLLFIPSLFASPKKAVLLPHPCVAWHSSGASKLTHCIGALKDKRLLNSEMTKQ